jgi:hypothetical protein
MHIQKQPKQIKMENTLIFNQYDMVISFTEDTINTELKKLVYEGTIKQEIVLYRIFIQKWVYMIFLKYAIN